jgi:DNA-binding transcriptional LysR family regulator
VEDIRPAFPAERRLIQAFRFFSGAALFIRTTRSVGLTEAGERFIARAKPAFEELISAGEAARD